MSQVHRTPLTRALRARMGGAFYGTPESIPAVVRNQRFLFVLDSGGVQGAGCRVSPWSGLSRSAETRRTISLDLVLGAFQVPLQHRTQQENTSKRRPAEDSNRWVVSNRLDRASPPLSSRQTPLSASESRAHAPRPLSGKLSFVC